MTEREQAHAALLDTLRALESLQEEIERSAFMAPGERGPSLATAAALRVVAEDLLGDVAAPVSRWSRGKVNSHWAARRADLLASVEQLSQFVTEVGMRPRPVDAELVRARALVQSVCTTLTTLRDEGWDVATFEDQYSELARLLEGAGRARQDGDLEVAQELLASLAQKVGPLRERCTDLIDSTGDLRARWGAFATRAPFDVAADPVAGPLAAGPWPVDAADRISELERRTHASSPASEADLVAVERLADEVVDAIAAATSPGARRDQLLDHVDRVMVEAPLRGLDWARSELAAVRDAATMSLPAGSADAG